MPIWCNRLNIQYERVCIASTPTSSLGDNGVCAIWELRIQRLLQSKYDFDTREERYTITCLAETWIWHCLEYLYIYINLYCDIIKYVAYRLGFTCLSDDCECIYIHQFCNRGSQKKQASCIHVTLDVPDDHVALSSCRYTHIQFMTKWIYLVFFVETNYDNCTFNNGGIASCSEESVVRK